MRGILRLFGTWEIGVNNGFAGTTDPQSGDPLIHWILGAGSEAGFERLLLDARRFEVAVAPRVLHRRRIDGVPVVTLRYVDGAGPYGGHDVLVATIDHGVRVWASVHGHQHDDVARRMLHDVLQQAAHGGTRRRHRH
jgi:hypothetical protein